MPPTRGRRVARTQNDALASLVLSDLAPATAAGTVLTPQGDKHITVADAWLAQAASAGIVTFATGTTPSPLSRLLRASARRALLDDGESLVHLHADMMGSLVMATGATGQILGERSYYADGQERQASGFVDAHGFTGQELDEGSGLLHFGYRDLDPLTGRWDASDPAFAVLNPERSGANGEATTGYAYVGNRSFDAVDPTGLKALWGKNAKDGFAKRVVKSLGRKMARKGLFGKANKKRALADRRNLHKTKILKLPLHERMEATYADPVLGEQMFDFLFESQNTDDLIFVDAATRYLPHAETRNLARAGKSMAIQNTFISAKGETSINSHEAAAMRTLTPGSADWNQALHVAIAASRQQGGQNLSNGPNSFLNRSD